MFEGTPASALSRLSSYVARIILVVGALIPWLLYDAFVFVASVIAVADSGGQVARGDWIVVAGIATLPVLALVVTATVRLRSGHLIPRTEPGRIVFAVQLAGVAGLAAAIAVPVFVLWTYFNPHAEIRVDNRTPYATGVRFLIAANECSLSDLVPPTTTREARVTFTELSCWGGTPTEIEIANALGSWRCDWKNAKSREPLLITEEGPGCDYTSYRPGILRWPPSTGGPPFSPPPAP
ncbi:MAG TPA: hypothetical protein VEZ14_01680 [Dehalococcoidia bacterium]|nr:hypothetical protein [Dehalococcoidia bacterium]